MVAQDGRGGPLLEPVERLRAMGTSVDEIPNREQPVASGVEPDLAERTTKRAEAPVHIPVHDVSASLIDADGTRAHERAPMPHAQAV